MKKLKVIARFLMAFILTISIVGFVLTYILSNTILSEKYILSSLKKADYYNKIYESVETNFEKYIQQSGLDEEVIKNIVTKEQVEQDTKRIVVSIFDGLHEEISTKEIEQNLKNNIAKYVNIDSLGAEEKKAIDDFTAQICKEYKETIANSDYEVQINSGYKKVMNLANKFKKLVSITIGICTIILCLLSLKRPYKIITNIAISFIASGLILTIINIYINTKVKVQYIAVLNDVISAVVRNIAQDILGGFLKYGVLLTIAGLILSIIANFVHNTTKYKSLMYDDTSKEK